MKKIFKREFLYLFLVLVVVVGALFTAFYFYQRYQKIKSNPNGIAKEEVTSITTDISRFMDLPMDEVPTLATVTDQEVLKSQDFFKNAQNGDKVLIYTKAHKAILYRPSTGRVVEFAPLTLGPQDTSLSSPAPTETVNVAIYNGTKTAGLTVEYEKKLVGIDGITVVVKTNAAKSDYVKTLVIDLSEKNPATANKIAQVLGVEVSASLPEGETKPQSDILIIAGE